MAKDMYNFQDSHTKEFRMFFICIFGREDLDFEKYEEAIVTGLTSEVLAKRKLLNPSKWVLFLLECALYSAIGVAMIALLCVAIPALLIYGICDFFSEGLGKLVLAAFKIFFYGTILIGLSIRVMGSNMLNCILAPYNALIQPYINFFRDQETPAWQSVCVIAMNLILMSIAITGIVLSGGALLAPILGFSVFSTNIMASVMSLLLIPAALKSLASTIKYIGISFHNMFFTDDDSEFMYNSRQKAVLAARGSGYSGPSNTYSRLLFNSPPSSVVLEPREQNVSYTFKKMFVPGWSPSSRMSSDSSCDPHKGKNVLAQLGRFLGL